MEKLIKIFEDYIGRYPDQWYNFYDYWREASNKRGGKIFSAISENQEIILR